ncbi:MAG: hypothetical protein ACXW1Y_10060 [Acidimicrobiia bacterium]
MESLSLRPLGVPEVIDAAFKLMRRHARTLFTIAAVVLLPLGILEYFLSLFFESNIPTSSQLIPESASPDVALEILLEDLGPLFLAALLSGLLAALAQAVVQLGSVEAIAEVYLDREPNWRTSLGAGLKRLPAGIGVFLIAVVPLTVGFLLCFLPGVWLAVMWSMVVPVLAVERLGPGASLGRSWKLVKNRFWPVLGVLALSFLISLVIQSILSAVVTASFLFSGTVALEIQALVNTVSRILVTPFTASVFAVLYFDLRVRQEGFDLERMAAAIGQPAPIPATGTTAVAASPGPESVPPPPPPPDDSDPFGLGRPGGS